MVAVMASQAYVELHRLPSNLSHNQRKHA
jgi:hypothetical protein